MKINILEPQVFNRISAGEVIERPASIVKEIVENSIDAGASEISIEIEEGGIAKIAVSDNGSGIEKDDLPLVFRPHATSKIKTADDLDEIFSLGFRGEAMASIAAVCHVALSSKTAESDSGYAIKIDGGVLGEVYSLARQNGTSVEARDLFYNVPVRRKFLRKPKTEEGEITALVEKFMLSHPEIAFRYYIDGKLVYNTTSCSFKEIIYLIYGKTIYEGLIDVDFEEDGLRLSGAITKPAISKPNRTGQTLFINGRIVENYTVSSAIAGVYESFLMKGRFPLYVLNLTVPADSVDVNVHPNKREVKFEAPSKIFGFVRRAVEKALLAVGQIADFVGSDYQPENELFTHDKIAQKNAAYFRKSAEPLSATEGSSYKKTYLFTEEENKPLAIKEATVEEARTALDEFKNLKGETVIPPTPSQILFDQAEKSLLGTKVRSADIERVRSQAENDNFLLSFAEDVKVLGTVFNTYIVAQFEDAVYFLDQHAGHERVLFDKLKKQCDEGRVLQQNLLLPYEFSLSAKERGALEAQMASLEKLGFKICARGDKFLVEGVPLVLSGINLSAFVDEIIAEDAAPQPKTSDFIHQKLCQTACKHAIKGGDPLSKEECAYLISQVKKGVMLCPHGRPIALKLTRKELEKMFGRIV